MDIDPTHGAGRLERVELGLEAFGLPDVGVDRAGEQGAGFKDARNFGDRFRADVAEREGADEIAAS